MTKQLSSETVDTVDNGTKTSVENVVENAAKSKVETGTNKHERNRRRSSDFDEEDWQEKGKVIDEVKICSYENNYKEVYFAKQTDTSISTVRRIFSFRTQKTAASWSSIFKLVKCLSNEVCQRQPFGRPLGNDAALSGRKRRKGTFLSRRE